MSTHDDRDDAAHRAHYALSRVAIAVLAVYVVGAAGVLLYVKQHAPEHPGVLVLEFVGFPALALLVLVFRRRRGIE